MRECFKFSHLYGLQHVSNQTGMPLKTVQNHSKNDRVLKDVPKNLGRPPKIEDLKKRANKLMDHRVALDCLDCENEELVPYCESDSEI